MARTPLLFCEVSVRIRPKLAIQVSCLHTKGLRNGLRQNATFHVPAGPPTCKLHRDEYRFGNTDETSLPERYLVRNRRVAPAAEGSSPKLRQTRQGKGRAGLRKPGVFKSEARQALDSAIGLQSHMAA